MNYTNSVSQHMLVLQAIIINVLSRSYIHNYQRCVHCFPDLKYDSVLILWIFFFSEITILRSQ